MSEIIYQQLDPIMVPLVNKFYQTCGVRGRAIRQDNVVVAKVNGTIVGAARLTQKEGNCLLVGVYSAPDFRNLGIAAALIKKLLNNSQEPIFTFAYKHLVPWYMRMMFTPMPPPENLKPYFDAYLKQGRKLTCLAYTRD